MQVYAPGRAIRSSQRRARRSPATAAMTRAWSGRVSRAGDYQVVLINQENSGTCGLDVGVY